MGEGNFQDYGMRLYNPRIGRFPSVDPLFKEYPTLTPYQFASDSPIVGVDRDGMEFEPYWATTVPMKIREYEKDLRKKDPNHAESIIRQQNIQAFTFVGSALTGGSQTLATYFFDGLFTYGTYKLGKGIVKKDANETAEGVHIIAGAMLGEIGGFVIGRTLYSLKALATVSGDETNILFSITKGKTTTNIGETSLNNGTLELDLNVPHELQNKGLGKSMFDQSIKVFGDKVKRVQGLWTDGTNLSLYNQLIKSGKTPEEAALNTVTGKWAQKNGFNKVEIIQDIKMKSGESGSVKVLFSKE